MRDDLEDALFRVAAEAVNAMVTLREQRSAQTVDPAAVTGYVHAAAAALRRAEATTAALGLAVPQQGDVLTPAATAPGSAVPESRRGLN
ncbi:MAG: hypothetical protein L0I76_17505 [Pseudonocardia sp.]|nr:hypothetical protein [Pseudonocardia sp.]